MPNYIIIFFLLCRLLFFTEASTPRGQIFSSVSLLQLKKAFALLKAHNFDSMMIILWSPSLLVLVNANLILAAAPLHSYEGLLITPTHLSLFIG